MIEYYGYDAFRADMKTLVARLDYKPDVIIAISRGGMTMGHFLGIALDIREVFVINAVSYFGREKEALKIFNIPSLQGFERGLIVDDIIDSGESLKKVRDILQEMNPDMLFKSASIFYKSTASIMPDYYIHEALGWIDFFWEVDLAR